ncbi:hypothetical protein O0L34_g17499 [Tuta absoluta]|nr:hypothetical protein O0L34_g17499 [Tuta absoluta]
MRDTLPNKPKKVECGITKHSTYKTFNWIEGVITKKIGTVLYKVFAVNLNCEVTRHIDQIRRRVSSGTKRRTWDPDVIRDLQVTDQPVGQPDADAGSSKQGDPRVELEGEESVADDSPASARVNTRRRELTPDYDASPTVTADGDCADGSASPTGSVMDDGVESVTVTESAQTLETSAGPSRSMFNFSNLF